MNPKLEKQVLPFVGGPRVSLKLRPVAALEKELGERVPAKPTQATEVARGVKRRIEACYDLKGNHDRSKTPALLVDLWVQRAGLAFTTGVLLDACSRPVPRVNMRGVTAYSLRRDAQPWRRLREHLVAAEPAQVKEAHAVAERWWKQKPPAEALAHASVLEVRCALAFSFCDQAWVHEVLDEVFEQGYGRWAVLSAITEPKAALAALKRLSSVDTAYQIYEEAVVHLPTLVKVAGPAARATLQKLRDRAFSKKVQKPFAELLAE